MKRQANPLLSLSGEQALAQYEQALCEHDSLDTTKLYIQGTRHDLQQAVETIAWT